MGPRKVPKTDDSLGMKAIWQLMKMSCWMGMVKRLWCLPTFGVVFYSLVML